MIWGGEEGGEEGGGGGEGGRGGSISPGRSGIRGPAHPFASQSKPFVTCLPTNKLQTRWGPLKNEVGNDHDDDEDEDEDEDEDDEDEEDDDDDDGGGVDANDDDYGHDDEHTMMTKQNMMMK